MQERLPVSQETIDKNLNNIRSHLLARIEKHGSNSCIGPHEILGLVTEEYYEYLETVHQNDCTAQEEELMDILIACLWGICSLRTNY